MTPGIFYVFLISLLSVTFSSANFATVVKAKETTCFYEEVEAGTRISVTFAVAEGGHLDIDVMIAGPDDEVIALDDAQHEGAVSLVAYMDGRYTYCFANTMSTVTDKTVMFNVEAGESPTSPEKAEDRHQALGRMISLLRNEIDNAVHAQQYMELRQKLHRQSNC